MLKNHMDFKFALNNDFCVYIDIHGRRYVILDLDVDNSNANHQGCCMHFQQYCHEPVMAFHVYNFLMSINMSGFNPCKIAETQEKQLYHENAIPTPI